MTHETFVPVATFTGEQVQQAFWFGLGAGIVVAVLALALGLSLTR